MSCDKTFLKYYNLVSVTKHLKAWMIYFTINHQSKIIIIQLYFLSYGNIVYAITTTHVL